MEHFNDFVSVFLLAASLLVSLEAGSCEDGVAWERSGRQGTAVVLAPEAVEDKVRQEDEVSLGRGRPRARRSEDQPATDSRRSGGRHLELVRSVNTITILTMVTMATLNTGQNRDNKYEADRV